jgi:hypothetical protein
MKYSRVPSSNPGLCYGCIFWEENKGSGCGIYRKENNISCVDEESRIHLYMFIKHIPKLNLNIKVI